MYKLEFKLDAHDQYDQDAFDNKKQRMHGEVHDCLYVRPTDASHKSKFVNADQRGDFRVGSSPLSHRSPAPDFTLSSVRFEAPKASIG